MLPTIHVFSALMLVRLRENDDHHQLSCARSVHRLQPNECTASTTSRSGRTAGQNLLDQGMRNASIRDEGAADTQLDGAGGVADLGDHAARDGLVVDEGVDVVAAQVGQQLHLLVQNAGDIRQEQSARRLELAGDASRRHVRVDVVGNVLLGPDARSDRRDDGRDSHVEQVVEQIRVDRLDFAHEAQIVPVLIDLLDALQQGIVASRQSHGPATRTADGRCDLLVDGSAQHHLGDVDDLL
mmetsp:Transcript_10368/g.28536  ORF Transcript_10368/g.28536 Transcript_10368/m.28536 type:complete len:240 (-) Transcript_10368:459-1178(-)